MLYFVVNSRPYIPVQLPLQDIKVESFYVNLLKHSDYNISDLYAIYIYPCAK